MPVKSRAGARRGQPSRSPSAPPVKVKAGPTEADYRAAFDAVDMDCSGTINWFELGMALKKLGLDGSAESAKAMIADADLDGDAELDFNEFLKLLLDKMSEKDSKEDAMRAFRQFDVDQTGKITFENLKAVSRELGEDMTDEEIHEMIEKADLDADGMISEEEFWRVLRKGW